MVVSGSIAEVRERVLGGGVIEVEVLGPADDFGRIVGADPLAGPVELRDGVHAFRYSGDAAKASDLLAGLVRGGVRVASFARKREGLEELFLKVGAKELS
jgi:ABC-2 type transport system ATP-binding protein